jgi:hypothetical protein
LSYNPIGPNARNAVTTHATYNFAQHCAELRDSNTYDKPILEVIMPYLMTELWDRGFSQSEIRTAFERAVAEMPRYAAGEQRRGDKDRK